MSTLKSYPHFSNHPGTKPQFISWIVSALQIFSVPWPLPSAHCLAHLVNSSCSGSHMFLPSPLHHENSWTLCKKITNPGYRLCSKSHSCYPHGSPGQGEGADACVPLLCWVPFSAPWDNYSIVSLLLTTSPPSPLPHSLLVSSCAYWENVSHYGVFLLVFILYGTLWASWIWWTVSFSTLEKFSTIISQNFSHTLSFSLILLGPL